jgi:DNA-binding beta-propeller fold protein YncE
MATQPEAQATANTVMQLAFQIMNYGANSSGTANVIYITTDASYNKIDLQIMLNTGSVTLTPASEIPDPNNPPSSGGTVMYFDLSNLQLGTTQFNQLQFSADNWQFKLFPDTHEIGMTPTQDVSLSAGTSGVISIHIAKMEIDTMPAAQTAQLYMSYYNVTGITGEYSGFAVAIQPRPDVKSGNLPDAIQVGLSSNTIINSYAPPRTVSNAFQLEFSPAPNPPQVPAGADTLFTVTFVYGKSGDAYGYGALTDVTDALNIEVTKGDNADQWIVTFDKTAQSPYWTLKPPAGAPIVGTGVEAIVSFNFANIQTPYQPGPTAMLVAYKNVPGYQDGVYTLILNKVPHVIIDSLTVTPNPAYFQSVQGQEQASVTVEWATRYDTSRLLTQNSQTIPLQPNQTQLPVTLSTDATNFTLTAYGQGGTQNIDVLNVSATVLPVINSFAGAPTEIFAGQQSQGVTLFWAVDTPGQVSISSSADPVHSQTSSAQNNLTQTVSQPQMFTLKPVIQENVLTLTRNLVISAFNLSPQNYTLTGAMSGAAASPSAPFAAFTNPSGNQVIIVDTVEYSQLTAVSVGKSPGAIAFSQDGSLMVTANTGDNTVSIVQVSIENGVPSFNSLGNVAVGGAPQQLFITPNKQYIYVTVDPGSGSAGQLVALKASNNSYTLDTQVAVGKAPRGLAVMPSGARIFVANSADDTISIIGVQGDTFTTLTPIENVTGTPTGLAMTPNGNLLLATCAGSNSVVAFSGTNPTTGSRQTLTVGKQPSQIAVTPTGAYAFVSNQGDGTVSLINCSGATFQASVLGQPVSVGATPIGVAVSPDGLVVLVADGSGFSIVSLQIYGAAQVINNVFNQPTDVVAAPDGSSALVWHDAMLTISGQQPTGAVCYAIASGSINEILGGVAIVQCVFHPSPSAHQAFAVDANGAYFYVIDTTNPESPTSKTQPLNGAFAPIAIAVSGDGQHLFIISADQSLKYTLFVLELAGGSWTQPQSIELYQGKIPGQVWLQATPDASTVLIIDGASNVFKALTWNTDKQQYQVADTSIQINNPVALTILPDGSKAFVVGRSTPSTITVIDIPTLQAETLSLIQNFVNLQGLVSAPDGRRLYGTDLSAGALRIFDPASLRILQTLPLAANISQSAQGAAGVAIAPDASRIFAVSTVSGTLSIFQQVPMF